MIPPTFVSLLLVYSLFLNKQRVKGDCSLDSLSLSSDICSSDTCNIVKDLPSVTNVYREQSVEVCASATSGCINRFIVYINGSHTTDFTTEQISNCFVVKYEVDNVDYNQTVRIKFFYRNNSNFVFSVSSNTTTINVKGPPYSPQVIVRINCTHLTIDWIAYDTDYVQINISCPQSQSMSFSNVITNISLLLVDVINKNEDCRLYNVSVWPHNPAGWGMASTKQVSTITDPHGEIKRDSITFQFINTSYISIQYKLLFKCISSYPITVTANTHCPHHTGDVLRSKIIKWNIKNTKPLILPKICGCDITTIKFSNYNNSVSKSLDTRGLVNVNVSVRLCEVTIECIFNTGYYGDCKVIIKSLTNNFNSSHIITQNGSNTSTISTVLYLYPGRYKIHGYNWNDSTKVLRKCPPVRTSVNVITCEPTPATKTSTNVTPTPGGAKDPHSHNIGAIIGGIVGGIGIILVIFVIVAHVAILVWILQKHFKNRRNGIEGDHELQPMNGQSTQPADQSIVESDINNGTTTIESTTCINNGTTTVEFTPNISNGTTTVESTTPDISNGTTTVESTTSSINNGTTTVESTLNINNGTTTVEFTPNISNGTTTVESTTPNINNGTTTVESTLNINNETTTVEFTPNISNGTVESTTSSINNGTTTVESTTSSINNGTTTVESTLNINNGTTTVVFTPNINNGTTTVEFTPNINNGTTTVEFTPNINNGTTTVEFTPNINNGTTTVESTTPNINNGAATIELTSSINNGTTTIKSAPSVNNGTEPTSSINIGTTTIESTLSDHLNDIGKMPDTVRFVTPQGIQHIKHQQQQQQQKSTRVFGLSHLLQKIPLGQPSYQNPIKAQEKKNLLEESSSEILQEIQGYEAVPPDQNRNDDGEFAGPNLPLNLNFTREELPGIGDVSSNIDDSMPSDKPLLDKNK